uniref:Toll-like receptor 4 n=1 Tax=Crassostrea virginica TaxID=6565 RepID=A0A8B8AQD5_CRAVI|nr:toll-like receptor 4 [Crassostrea virginica]
MMRTVQWNLITLLLYSCPGFIISRQCAISPYVDECNNTGFLWNCSGLGLNTLPRKFPPELKNQNVTLDLSFNNISEITKETFREISLFLNLTTIKLHHNNFGKIGKNALSMLSSLCSLDISYCSLDKNQIDEYAFVNTKNLRNLKIHHNNFQKTGYPDLSISKIPSLKYLKIDLFEGFVFSEAFENLTELSKIEFNNVETFSLTNDSFHGLERSPIYSLDMFFKMHVKSDVTEDLFCSFPYLTQELSIKFGGYCNVTVALRSLKCLQHRKIEKIDLSENKKYVFSDSVIINNWSMKYLINICVKVLDLGHNNIFSLKTSIINTTLWLCLENLYLESNQIHVVEPSTITFVFTLPKIRNINVCCNNIPIPVRFKGYYGNFLQNIIQQTFSFNFTLPDTLEVLDVTNNYIHNIKIPGVRFVFSAERLQELYIQNTNFPLRFIRKLKFPLLKKINVSQNSFAHVRSDIFQNSLNLEEIFAEDVGFIFSAKYNSQNLFQNLKNLSLLDISKNRLKMLPQTIFLDQKFSLTEINLDNNMFTVIPNPILFLKKLKFLSVRNNLISYFSREDQVFLQSMHNLSIHLIGNPISCACSHIRSLRWMKNHQHLFGDLPYIICTESKTPITEIFQNNVWRKFELDCQADNWLILASVLLFLMLIILLISSAVKRYRAHLEYVILRLKNRWKGTHLTNEGNSFVHDVYVSYSDPDYAWIIQKLYPKLEHLNMKAWLKDKDSIPGAWEAEEIVKCINDSRKVMFVISDSFLDVGWSSYAVQMAVTHAFHNHRQESIVVIIKDNVLLDRLPNDIKNIWWCIEYFRWTESETDEDILDKLSGLLICK